jgi:hypothetical protein
VPSYGGGARPARAPGAEIETENVAKAFQRSISARGVNAERVLRQQTLRELDKPPPQVHGPVQPPFPLAGAINVPFDRLMSADSGEFADSHKLGSPIPNNDIGVSIVNQFQENIRAAVACVQSAGLRPVDGTSP